MNLSQKWKQFEAELIRMSQYKYPYLICEFPIEYIDIFPDKSGIPASKLDQIRMPGWVIKKRLLENCSKYNINTIFCHDAEEAQQKVIGIIEEICK